MSKRYDCVVIGGGHNGLVTAAYLARAGKSVCVLERRDVLGGCATTEALWPGYRVSTGAYLISLFLPAITRDLKLEGYGLRILPRDPSSFTPLLDGRSLTLGPDRSENQRQIAKFSARDAEAFPAYEKFLERVAAVLEPLLESAAPDPLPLPSTVRAIGPRKRLRDGVQMWRTRGALADLGEDLPEAIRLLVGAARPFLEHRFESEPLLATLATDAVIGAFASISSPGTAYVLLHHVMGEAGGARGIWGYVEGGMGGLADALESAATDLGVEIQREAEVERILASGGQVRGVGLSDGSDVEASVVASSVDAHWTFERFLEPGDLPRPFREAVARIDYSSASAKINLALGEAPRFECLPSDGLSSNHRATIHIAESLDYLERAYEDARHGKPSHEPLLEVTIPTSLDTTIAPEGKHILSMFVQYAPYDLADGATWDEHRDAFADRCIELLARYAPNVPGAIEHKQILTPPDLERVFRITGGNIMQGAMSLDQLFSLRPVPGWSDHRTPVRGLYLCGAASHPGGGVMGACGRNAALEILRDD